MLSAIDFYNQFPSRAVKIDYVMTYIFLPIELRIVYLFSPDLRPDKMLGISHVTSEISCKRFKLPFKR